MTCIVAAAHKDTIYMVADSSSVDEDANVRTTKDEKVFRKTLENGEDILVGMAGSWRAIQLIKHDLVLPPIRSVSQPESYISIDLINAIKEKYAHDGLTGGDDDGPNPAEVLIGIRGRLFFIDSWYQACHFDDLPFHAIGTGIEYCLGAANVLWGELNDYNIAQPDVEGILEAAIRTAAKFNARVRAPFYHHALSPRGAVNLEVVA